MFYTLMEKGMLKKIKIYVGSGFRFVLYSKQISYQGQPKVIAKSNNLNYPPQKILYSFVASNSFLQLGLYFSSSLGGLKLTLVIIFW